jgi:Holliday junction resolvase RusA-like endonuclease
MAQLLHWFVEGIPVPQGSKTAMVVNGRAVMFEANKKHKAWREHVSATIPAMDTPSTNPVRVELMFYFNRPKSVKREHMSVKPDLDKLSRCILDCLSGRIVKDDSQVVILNARKEYTEQSPGVLVRVYEID